MTSKQMGTPFLGIPSFPEPQQHKSRQQQQQPQQEQQQQQPQQPHQLQQQREEAAMAVPKTSSKDKQGPPSSFVEDSRNRLHNGVSAAGSFHRKASRQDPREDSPKCHIEAPRPRTLQTEDCGFPSLQPPPNPRSSSADEAAAQSLPVQNMESCFLPVQDERTLTLNKRCNSSSSSSSSRWVHDDCRTPYQQEIPLGSWPSPEKAPVPHLPINDNLFSQQRREAIQYTTNQASCGNTRTLESGFSLSHPHEREAVVMRTPIPAAAMPAYFPL
ncbi:hypothetical protein, conserved [Eimeria praecox]|uniref:Uncharacterized protein n=1 Tax=Eimeria praecox TaxID=51316 RepID=U6G519_9EIME|nr:hypothetical protein, conserved [Eimeria praecox]